jgi:xanthine/uracil permease
MTHSLALPRALRANALASLVAGLAGVLMSAPLSQTIGLIPGTSFQVIGAALVVHAGVVMWATGRASIATWTRRNIALLAGLILLLVGVLSLGAVATPLGRALLILGTVLVAGLGLWQVRALSASMPRPAQ